MRRAVLISALVLGVLIDGFFAVINFVPVAPPRSRGPRRYVVAEFDPSQAAWFQSNVLDEYNDEHGTNLMLRATDEEDIGHALSASDVVVAVLPSARAAEIAQRGGAAPFDGAVPGAQIAGDFGAVRAELLRGAAHHGRQFFLPRATVLDVAVYRISRVRDAMLHWQLVRPEIDDAIRAVNGHGLPAGYTLEQEPPSWDSYDVFVLAYYWAHRFYDGKPARARVSHRTGLGIDAQLDITAAIYRAGGSDETLAQRDATASLDWFQWEALFRAEGIYADEMFAPGGVDDEETLGGLERGDLYLTSLDQMEAFTLHGGAHAGARSLVPDEDDLGFVALPRFASLALDPHDVPLRTAEAFSYREEAVWILPSHSPDPGLAYALAAWDVEHDTHTRECEALGMLPTRIDVVRERATLFRSPWMQDVFTAGLSQWRRAEIPPPGVEDEIGLDYAAAWESVVAERRAPPTDRDALAALLRAPVDRAAARRAQASQGDEPANGGPAPGVGRGAFPVPPLRDPVVLVGLGSDGGVMRPPSP